jgi:hypothetical protein
MARGTPYLVGALGAVGAVAIATMIARRRFEQRIDALQRTLEMTAPARRARIDLPPEVLALARRLVD